MSIKQETYFNPLVIEAAHQLDLQLCYYTEQQLYIEADLYSHRHWYLAHAQVKQIDDIGSLCSLPCIKLGAYGDGETLREKRQLLEQRFMGQLYVTQTAHEWLEFLHPEVSKANALRTIAQLLNIPSAEIMAIGDNHNDIEMLRLAGLGVAMGNAHAEIKSVADYVTLSNDEDGAALAIEKFVLNPKD
ncbi:HAD-IIB family hydrolase [Dictyobacter arantiisoli]|uniref:Haloacid dehalogenase n=1 Tax=Dictyobacter arantiisoli TaxID=2014874 RepID=A0A5A5TJW9_9CHLR|nr:HAD-IIB family hydrolase [Dictyobacter arantiisoli]GCF11921.1 hypothetical protein KDI_54850 [Dictyobacter arantiisoli]